jgi:hypothetical protein
LAASLLHQARFTLACMTSLVRQIEALGPLANERPAVNREQSVSLVAVRVLDFLQKQTDRVSGVTIKRNVRGRSNVIDLALELLRLQRQADYVSGPRNSRMWLVTTDAEVNRTGGELRNG